MPKYFRYKICGYYLYFTSHCIVEAMHAHASDSKLTEAGSAKFFVLADGSTKIVERGVLSDRELSEIQSFIRDNYLEMYNRWSMFSTSGFYKG